MPANTKEKRIPIVEMFGPVFEGEGAVIGHQTMFIRFGLCDSSCKRCDSKHAVDPQMVKQLAKWMTQKEIIQAVLAHPSHIKTITFSGGNPAIHELGDVVDALSLAGYKIIVETQGTKHPTWLRRVDHVVLSPKSPGMGEKFDPKVFIEFMRLVVGKSCVEYSIKIVVFTNQDLEFAVGVTSILEEISANNLLLRSDWRERFYLSLGNPNPPVFSIGENTAVINDSLSNNALVEKLLKVYNILSDEILKDPRLSHVKFLPQLHVLCYGNETGR